MRADFQQFYHLNIDGMGVDYSHVHAAFLFVQLPRESRSKRILNPDFEFSLTDLLLRELVYSVSVLVWQRTKDGQKGRNEPKRIPLPSDDDDLKRLKIESDRAYVDAVLSNRGGEN